MVEKIETLLGFVVRKGLRGDVLAAPPCGGGGSQIMIRYSIATGLRAVVLAVEDSRWAGLGRLRTRGVDLRRRTET